MAQASPEIPEVRTLINCSIADVLSTVSGATNFNFGVRLDVLQFELDAPEGTPALELTVTLYAEGSGGPIPHRRLTVRPGTMEVRLDAAPFVTFAPATIRIELSDARWLGSDASGQLAVRLYYHQLQVPRIPMTPEALAEYVNIEEELGEYAENPLEDYMAVDEPPVQVEANFQNTHFIGRFAEDPPQGEPGDMYYNSSDDTMRVLVGEEWFPLAPADHLPAGGGIYGDVGSDTSVVIGNGPRLRGRTAHSNLRLYDAYVCDVMRGQGHCPKNPQTRIKHLFVDLRGGRRVTNNEVAGMFPDGTTGRVQRVGLGLQFSDPKMYRLAFQCIQIRLDTGQKPQWEAKALDYLDAAVADDDDFNAEMGFSRSLPLDSDITLLPRQSYEAELIVEEPLLGELRKGEDALDYFWARHDGKWRSDEDRERYHNWYAEIKVTLIGRKFREYL